MRKYLILGNGWIGNLLRDYLGDAAIMYGGDIRMFENPPLADVIINTAAKTNIDWCEKNKLEAFDINVNGAVRVAKWCKANNRKYVFISSACIFESENKKDKKMEYMQSNPACFYAKTKAFAEDLIMEVNPNTLIIRPRLPISEKPHPRNTINKLLSYNQIQTNQESVTVVEDMIPKILELIEIGQSGPFHVVNQGTISMVEICNLLKHKFKKVSKNSQDKRMESEGRARRVTTIVGSTRTDLLPNIKQRIISVIENYNGALKRK